MNGWRRGSRSRTAARARHRRRARARARARRRSGCAAGLARIRPRSARDDVGRRRRPSRAWRPRGIRSSRRAQRDREPDRADSGQTERGDDPFRCGTPATSRWRRRRGARSAMTLDLHRDPGGRPLLTSGPFARAHRRRRARGNVRRCRVRDRRVIAPERFGVVRLASADRRRLLRGPGPCLTIDGRAVRSGAARRWRRRCARGREGHGSVRAPRIGDGRVAERARRLRQRRTLRDRIVDAACRPRLCLGDDRRVVGAS